MGTAKKIIIAEDHRLFREGIKALLESKTDFEIVCEAENGLEAIRCARKHKADLMLLQPNPSRQKHNDLLRRYIPFFARFSALLFTRRPKKICLQNIVNNADAIRIHASPAGELFFYTKGISQNLIAAMSQSPLH